MSSTATRTHAHTVPAHPPPPKHPPVLPTHTVIASCTRRATHPLTGLPTRHNVMLSRDEWRGRCGDAQRLVDVAARTAHLRQPGGPYDCLTRVSGKVTTVAAFTAYVAVALEAHPRILDERLKGWWAFASFNRYRANRACLEGFASYKILAGSLQHGTADERPVSVNGQAPAAVAPPATHPPPPTHPHRSPPPTPPTVR